MYAAVAVAHPFTLMILPKILIANCEKSPLRKAWMDRLPALVKELGKRWSVQVGEPFEHSGECSWVAPALRADGTSAVLKLGMPHMEGEQEIRDYASGTGIPPSNCSRPMMRQAQCCWSAVSRE